jgi:heme/copper-type cytochrome/quinol oxidase subunit 1
MNIKQGSTTFLKVIIFLIGIAVLALCIYWLPEIAIRDVKAHPGDYSLYPILGFAYGCCIAFSVALYQVFRLLTYIERNNAFSELSLKSLKVIKKCGLTTIFFIVLGIVTLKVIAKVTGDDPAGPISLSLMGILATSIITAIVDVLQKLLKNLLDTKPEND